MIFTAIPLELSLFIDISLCLKDPKVNIAVAANAGWYTFLNGANFPYGVKNPPILLSDSKCKSIFRYQPTYTYWF